MNDNVSNAELLIRLVAFVGVFAFMALLEALAPRRQPGIGRLWRWPSNLGVVVVDTFLVRLLFPTAAVGFALWAEKRGWGVLSVPGLPQWVRVVIGVVMLDFAIYGQHVLFHAVPVLWRVHRMHHADLELDVTTGVRFHPVEIVLSMLIKFAVVALVGIPAVAVLIFEILLNATSMFSHSNVRIPERFDAVLRWLLVTPDMHRIHHSIERRETNSNFGFNLPWWDRLFGTYRARPETGHDRMVLGLPIFRDRAELRLDRMLLQPFRADRERREAVSEPQRESAP